MRIWRRRQEPPSPGEPPTQEEPEAGSEAVAGDRPEGEAGGGGAEGAGGEASEEPSEKRGILAETRAALAPIGRRHLMVASMGILGIGFFGLVVFTGVSMWWTSQPSFCNRCHVMNKYVEAWEQGSHKDVNCESCHLTPGLFGFVGGKISGLQVVANYIMGDYEDYSFNAVVPNASCLQCHEQMMSEDVHNAESGVKVSHLDIIEMGGKCMNCHSTVGHGPAVPFGSATHPTMDSCLKCHDDEVAPLDCDLCHAAKGPRPESPSATPPGG